MHPGGGGRYGPRWGEHPCSSWAEQRRAADCLQRSLRSRFRQQLTPSVRCLARQEFTHKRGKDSMTDVVAFKERQQQGYLTGDFGIIARTMVIVGELLVIPEGRCTGVALLGERCPDLLEVLVD